MRRAFTLVEVLVAVVIIGIVSAAVVPSLMDQGQMGTQAAARIIITDLLYAQNEAIAAQKPRRVVFDVPGNNYYLTDENGTLLNAPWMANGSVPNYLIDFDKDRRFADVNLGTVNFGGATMVEFDALGGPDRGGTIDLISTSTRYRISVAPMTGRVTVAPLP
jgi:prepilin-type N-terminal cleavage/methylation domain-containing protein